MVGYALSHDQSGNWKNISITVLDADDFAMESYGCNTSNFLYNRDDFSFMPVSANQYGMSCEPKLLKNIVAKLQTEELKSSSSVSVMWRSFPDSGVEIVKTELSAQAWLPLPVIRDGALCDCIDITKYLFEDGMPKPFEVSIAVCVLNYLVWMSGIKISTVFFDCKTRMFMNSEFVRPLVKIFGVNPFADVDYISKYTKIKLFAPQVKVDIKRIITNLKINCPDNAVYEGGIRSIAIGIKNDCIKRCADSLMRCLLKHSSAETFADEFKNHIQKAISEYKVLSELFVAGENLYRTGDIMYLGINDFLEACAFGESLLNLKKTVRDLTESFRIINKQKIPDIIRKNGEYIFLKGREK